MDGQQGATPAEPAASATGEQGTDEDIQAQELLADAVASGQGDADEPLGEGGKKALQAEREARKALEKKIGEFDSFKSQLAELVGGKPADGKSEVDLLREQFQSMESTLTSERSARWRAEIAQEKGLTARQAARLVGSTREELAADADELLETFPTAPAAPGTPKPDRSQGGNGGSAPDLDAQIKEAQKNGEVRKVLALQRQKLANQ